MKEHDFGETAPPAFIIVPDREDCTTAVDKFQQGRITAEDLVNLRQISPEMDLVEAFRQQSLL